MSVFLLIVVLLVLALAGYLIGRRRALASVGGDPRKLHSLPGYYGWHLALWVILQPLYIERQLSGFFPSEQFENDAQRTLLLADVRRVAQGLDTAVAAGALSEEEAGALRAESESIRERLAGVGVALGSEVTPEVLVAAQQYRVIAATGGLWRAIVALVVALASFAWAMRITNGDLRARNRVEAVILGLLILASTIAILTTIGIVMSMLSETIRFSTMYPFTDFLFGLTWSPTFQGNSQLGLIPLLWGTLYISLVSMIVAVPIGL
ncbi:MAG: phosphate ABC transporter permease family protein, partial [Rhodobacteraceae bacterium]|nr:phosphate ABC transporter permease family protein [Paracoccaceae bacterium]